MEAFNSTPPNWTDSAIHGHGFSCPTCRAGCVEAEQAWINRRSPVFTETYQRRWQEFYQCHCGCAWWAWSSDRPAPPQQFQPPSQFTRGSDL